MRGRFALSRVYAGAPAAAAAAFIALKFLTQINIITPIKQVY
jgi:hypothetical protein